MASKKQRKPAAPPSFLVYADGDKPTGDELHVDLIMSDIEEMEYQPHAGEWVRFRKDLPWRLTQLDEDTDNAVYCRGIVAVLVRQIIDWSWTGEEWDEANECFVPHPKPADKEAFESVLWNLSGEERRWLRDNCWYTEPKNA